MSGVLSIEIVKRFGTTPSDSLRFLMKLILALFAGPMLGCASLPLHPAVPYDLTPRADYAIRRCTIFSGRSWSNPFLANVTHHASKFVDPAAADGSQPSVGGLSKHQK
jgi:hypothetical protein